MYFPASLLDDRGTSSTASDKIGQCVLYIVRHANVAEDSKGLIRGLLNPPLDAKGKRGAQDVVEFFKDKPISAIYADDLKRTKQTALPLAADKELEVQIDPDLRSWDVGTELEGKPIDEHEDEIAELRQQPDKIPVGGQSWGEYCDQVDKFLSRYMWMGLDAESPIALISHGSAIQVIFHQLGEDVNLEDYAAIPIMPGGVCGLYYTRFGARIRVLAGEHENEDA
jgi:broad specificity phosphatase PhoE